MSLTKASFSMISGAPVNVLDFGADPTGVNDSTTAIQNAINAAATIYFPAGTYLISQTLRQATNGRGTNLIGENQQTTIIQCGAGMTSTALIWFGNSSGNGDYYGKIENMTIDGHSSSNNNTGILYQSCGLSSIRNVTIQNCGRAAWMHGCIATDITSCNFFDNYECAYWDLYPQGTPSGPNDLTVQALQHTNANESRMEDCWLSGCTANAVYITGGNFLLQNNTFQSCTNSALYDVIHVYYSNESYDYGAGPIIRNNWMEGGTYRYGIYCEHTRQVRIENNNINGSFTADGTKEGGIFLDEYAKNYSIKNNAIRGTFNATPTVGSTNAAIYVKNSSYTYTLDIENNYIANNQTNVYWEGLTSPAVDRFFLNMYAAISVSAGVATVTFQSMNFISSITKNTTGDFTITYNFNREVLASGNYPIQITSFSNGSGVTYSVSDISSTTSSDRLIFNNNSGSAADPAGFNLLLVGGGWQQV